MTAHPSGITDTTDTHSQPGRTYQGGTLNTRRDGAWYALDEIADVRFLPSGTPLALRWRGSVWQVIGEPLMWSSSGSWSNTDAAATATPPDGRGSTATTRFWRYRVQTSPSSPVLEFDMSTSQGQGNWRLRRVAGTTDY